MEHSVLMLVHKLSLTILILVMAEFWVLPSVLIKQNVQEEFDRRENNN